MMDDMYLGLLVAAILKTRRPWERGWKASVFVRPHVNERVAFSKIFTLGTFL